MKKFLLVSMVACMALLGAPAAFAHGDIDRLRPEAESVKAKSPDHVMITFTEAPTKDNQIAVTDGCDQDVIAEKYVQGRTLHVFLDEGASGQWNVDYAVISAEDGHKTQGGYSFTVQGETDCSEPEPEPEPDATSTVEPVDGDDGGVAAEPDTTSTSDEGSSGIPIAVVGIGVLALIGIAFLVRMGAARD